MSWFLGLAGWQQALIATVFTWLMTAFGAMLVFVFKSVKKSTFAFMLSGAAGIMLASTFFSLLMPAIERCGEFAWLVLTLGFIVGGAVIILTDVIFERLNVFTDTKMRSSAVMCVAVTVHNIPEGLAVGVAFGALAQGGSVSAVSAIMLAVGIGIQNFPEGMCVAFPLRANDFSRFKSFFIGQLSGAVEILSGVIGALAVTAINGVLPWALSFSAGAMLAVVCSELIPESFDNGKVKATLGVVFGFALMMILDIAFG